MSTPRGRERRAPALTSHPAGGRGAGTASRHALWLAALCAVVFAQAWTSLRHKSLTFDELTYIPAGYSYVLTGDYRLNPEHPPLTKLLAGTALLTVRPALDTDHPSWAAADQWAFGRHFFEESNQDVARIVSAARVPFVLLTMLLVVGAYALARELYGPTAGLLAAWLCAFSPNLLAHGRLATTDLGHATFVLWTVLASLWCVRRPSARAVVLTGVMLGLALLTKYTAVLLLGLLPLWALVRAVSGNGGARERSRRLGLAAAAVIGAVTVAAVVLALGYRSPAGVGRWAAGLGVLYTNVNLEIPTYFHGAFHPGGLPWYFIAAFVLKTPSAFLLLLLLRVGDQVTRRELDRDGALFLWLPALAWLVVISASALQFGLRYILPVYPLAFVYGAGIVASPRLSRRGPALVVAALALAFAAGSLRAHPHYLPYFNILAGGPDEGIEWLDDSNVDWGQDLPLLADYLDAHGIDDAVVAPMAWYDPAIYGVRGRWAGAAEIVPLLGGPSPPPGVYAVSAHLLTRGRFDPSAPIDPLSDLAPVAVLGHSIYVYRIGGS